MEHAVSLAPENPEALYDLAVIRLAAGNRAAAFKALGKALILNPKLKSQTRSDSDLESLRQDQDFIKITR
jgi:Flp pilus assembly protein TadD